MVSFSHYRYTNIVLLQTHVYTDYYMCIFKTKEFLHIL